MKDNPSTSTPPMKKTRIKVNGWIILDKSSGMTSTDAVNRVRRLFNAEKAGHAGTLDPLATGILPIALGEATKTIPYIQDAAKLYRFAAVWGEARNTDDAEGVVTHTSDKRPTDAEITAILPRFTGEIDQVPPKFSAIKINGERAYDLARAGEDVELASRKVWIDSLKLLENTREKAVFEVDCGKGTYMRSLVRDMAQALGTFGYISDLRRLAVGHFDEKSAILLDDLEKIVHSPQPYACLLPVETALADIPALALTEQEAGRLVNGQVVSFISRQDIGRLATAGIDIQEGPCVALATSGQRAVAVVEVDGPQVRPVRVLNL